MSKQVRLVQKGAAKSPKRSRHQMLLWNRFQGFLGRYCEPAMEYQQHRLHEL